MSDALRVNNIHFGNVASNHNQAHIGFTSVGIGSTANYGSLQFIGVPNTLCWTANGTVGIGTTAPSANLHIYNSSASFTGAPTVHIGDGQADATGTYGMVNLVRANNAADNKAHLSFIKNGLSVFGMGYYPGTGLSVFGLVPSFSSMATSTGLWINNIGNVGIGVTNPRDILHISQSSSGNLRLAATTAISSSSEITFDNALSGYWHLNGYGNNPTTSARGAAYAAGMIRCNNESGNNYENSYMTFWTCRDPQSDGMGGLGVLYERMRITSSGNVGIGTANPTYTLDVVGNIRVTGSITSASTNIIPKGIIVMWSGSVSNIPAGWVLCNGTNDAPDLRNRFIVGAGTGSSYSPGDIGGENLVTLTAGQMPSHNHSATDSGHTHVYEAYVRNTGNNADNGSAISAKDNPLQRDYNTSLGYANISIGYTGGNQAHENRPPYYALCYIMKS